MNQTPRSFNLARWQKSFEDHTNRLDALKLAIDSAAATNGAWTRSQCVEHLSLTAKSYLVLWGGVLQSVERIPGSKYAIWWRWFLSGISNPEKLKAKTTSMFEPADSARLEIALDAYLPLRMSVFEKAVQIEEAGKGGVKMQSPFAKWMKYPADFSLDLWLHHEERHLIQAENV